jgi:O-antigen ligase
MITLLVVLFLVAVFFDGWFILVAGTVAPSHVVLFCLFVVTVVERRLQVKARYVMAGLAITVYIVFVGFWADSLPTSVFRLSKLAYYVLTLWVIMSLASRIALRRAILLTACLVALGCAAALLLQGSQANRFTLADEYNPSWVAGMASPLILAVMSVQNPRPSFQWRLLSWISIGILCAVVLAAQGRNALVALFGSIAAAAAMTVMKAFRRRPRLAMKAAVTVGAILAAAMLMYSYPSRTLEFLRGAGFQVDRLELTLTGTMERATAGRTRIWTEYIDAMRDGAKLTGMENSADATRPRTGRDTQPHNMYLRLLVELGLPALVTWCAFHLVLVVKAYRTHNRSVLALAAFFPLFAMGNDVLYYKYYWFGLFLLALVYRRETRGTALPIGTRVFSGRRVRSTYAAQGRPSPAGLVYGVANTRKAV